MEMRAACGMIYQHARGDTWPSHLLFSCTLATKPVRGICGVSWGMGGGGGAIDTEHHPPPPPPPDRATEIEEKGKTEDTEEGKKSTKHY